MISVNWSGTIAASSPAGVDQLQHQPRVHPQVRVDRVVVGVVIVGVLVPILVDVLVGYACRPRARRPGRRPRRKRVPATLWLDRGRQPALDPESHRDDQARVGPPASAGVG
ncbi:MAG: hypothetical protein R3B49_09860 [Phycisphaerales bacterium]